MIGNLQPSGGIGFGAGQQRKNQPFLPGRGLYKVLGFHFDEALALTKWQGMSRYNTTKLQESAVDAQFVGLFDFTKSNQTKQAIAAAKAGIYKLNSGVWDLLKSGLTGTVNDYVDFVVLRDLLLWCNGVDGALKYDGTTWYNLGLAAPGSAPTAASGGAGALSGNYSYKVTFYNAALAHESNPSAVSNTFAASSNQISLTGIPTSADAQVTRRRLYRTSTGGATWRYLAEIADNTTTTHTDNLADSTLGVEVEFSANGLPPTAAMWLIWRGFTFAVPKNSSRVHFSKQNFPNAFHANDYRDLDPDDNDVVTGLHYLDGPVAFKNDSIWNGFGNDRHDIVFEKKVSGIGSVNHVGIVKIPGKPIVMFPSEEGFYSYNGINEEYLSKEIESEWRSLNRARLRYLYGEVYKPKNTAWWLASSGASGQHDLLITFDYVQGQWATRSIANTKANVLAIIEDASNNESVYLGGYGGHVWQGDSGLSDDGAAISCEVIDRAHPKELGAPNELNSFSEIRVYFKPQAGVTATVSYAIDDPEGTYVSAGPSPTIDCSATSGMDSVRFDAQGLRLFPKVANSATGQPLTIRGIEVDYQPLGRQIR